MPRKQPTAAQRARQRQASTGQKYTAALRAEIRRPVTFGMFSAAGAGWAPIIERAERRLREVWPEDLRPYWGEKFGNLVWKGGASWSEDSKVWWPVVYQAVREASFTCQTCPSPGRKRVVGVGLEWGGAPWVKTCCDACYYVPPYLRSGQEYLSLVEHYEDHG